MAKIYNTIYMDIRQRLRKAGVEEAQLEARELICCATGKSREEFYRCMQLYATTETEAAIETLVQRRLGGEPLAYILGHWDFYGLDLLVNSNVLIPRPDTERVAERAIEIAKGSGDHARVLDLCCGTGCIGLAVAKHAPNCRVVLADISEEALSVARKNMVRTGLSGQITTFRADALERPPELIWDFNLIVCNPPYVRSGDMAGLEPSVRDFEPALALDGGPDGLEFYRRVAANWRKAMRSTCILLFEVGDDQADAVERILIVNGYRNIRRHKDAFGNWRGVEGSVM
ncbi:MAG: peptide chain release factor N(5)-glutamine methyltransferase [Clostridiales bacterium]|nr:peptide chain release factor N(5)-glutamine methyltransferase [Clostridiales bacterium]